MSAAYKLDRGRDRKPGRTSPDPVRPSGAEPVIRVTGEADDQALADALVSDVCEAVAGAA